MRILGKNKFENFDGFQFTGKKKTILIEFTDGSNIECAENHAVLLLDGTWSLIRELIPGDILEGNKEIYSKFPIGEKDTFSPINVGEKYEYYSNGIISHNCAFIDKFDEFFASVYPTISSGEETKLLFTSTPNGLNHFYKTWDGAINNKNGYAHVKVMWYDVPGRDEKWKEETLQALDYDMEKFNAEYECGFLGSSGTLISGEKLKQLVSQRPINEFDKLKQYEPVMKDHIYTIICDSSKGKGLDYAAFSVIDVTSLPYKQVCTFRDNFIGPVDYAGIIYRIAKMYNEAMVLVELNNMGAQVADVIFMDYGYENLLSTESAGRSGKRVSSGFGKNLDRGIFTSKSVKATGCSLLKLIIEQNQLIINDFNTIEELSKFSKKGASYEAESGANDDLVMGLVLFAWLTDQYYFKEITDINILNHLKEVNEQQMEENLLPFGFIIDGADDLEDIVPTARGWLDF